MDNLTIATLAGVLILLASMASVEFGLSVAIIEIVLGVIGGNFLGLHTTPWIDFLAGFASIVLTFLAGAEVDPDLLRERWKESLLIGGMSFLAPFLGAIAFAYWRLKWSNQAAQIAGVALSTTSLAVLYAVFSSTALHLFATSSVFIMSESLLCVDERPRVARSTCDSVATCGIIYFTVDRTEANHENPYCLCRTRP